MGPESAVLFSVGTTASVGCVTVDGSFEKENGDVSVNLTQPLSSDESP